MDVVDNLINPNLLINTDFSNPINQRGNTEYFILGPDYGFDMWTQWRTVTKCINGELVISAYDFPSEGRPHIGQFLHNIDFSEIYTVSMIVNDISISHTSSDAETVVYENSDVYINIYYAGGVRRLTIQLKHVDAVIRIKNPKLEYSSISTKYIKPNHSDELIKCTKYLHKIPLGGSFRLLTDYVYKTAGKAYVRFIYMGPQMDTASGFKILLKENVIQLTIPGIRTLEYAEVSGSTISSIGAIIIAFEIVGDIELNTVVWMERLDDSIENIPFISTEKFV